MSETLNEAKSCVDRDPLFFQVPLKYSLSSNHGNKESKGQMLRLDDQKCSSEDAG
jgi:hypothetical protein